MVLCGLFSTFLPYPTLRGIIGLNTTSHALYIGKATPIPYSVKQAALSTFQHWELKQNSRGRRRQRLQQDKKQDKKRTWICEIKLAIVPSWAQMRLQLLHFHAVFKTWPTFQELTSNVSFRRRRWSHGISAKIETYRITKVKMCSVKYEDYEEMFFLPPDVGVAIIVCLRSLLSAAWYDKTLK